MANPNDDLAALVEAAHVSWAGLARRLNELGVLEGLALRYDYTAVHRWIRKGERPRPPVPRLIAHVLSEKLGRPVSPGEFAMSDEASLASRGLAYHPHASDSLETIAEIGRADVKRRSIVTAPFVLAALAGPSRDWLLATLDEGSDGQGHPRQIGPTQIAGIREMFALFQAMDVMRGGGHARTALVEYMNSHVLPLVQRDHGNQQVQLALYEAAAEQAYLTGWMAYDDGQHGLAERYLIQALRLAQASGNRALGAHVLAGMSDQTNLLGHPREAVMLARAGRQGITLDDSPACLADLHILEARALAALGDTSAAAHAVTQAEAAYAHVNPDNEPEWARFIDDAYLYGEAAKCFTDLGDTGSVDQFATASATAAARQQRARRGALSHTALALSLIDTGQPDAAAHTGQHVIGLASTINSSRCLDAIRDLANRLAPYRELADVQDFHQRAHDQFGITENSQRNHP